MLRGTNEDGCEMTPEKYRDRIYKALIRYIAKPRQTARQRKDAYEDLMVVIDEAIEELSTPKEAQHGR